MALQRVAPSVRLLMAIWLSLASHSQAENHTCIDGDIQLAGGPNEFEGRVEICLGGVWGQVCEDAGFNWGSVDAKVVCRQLVSPYVIDPAKDLSLASVDGFYGNGTGSFTIDNVDCQGNESSLRDCTYFTRNGSSSCNDNGHAGVVCQDPVCFDNAEHVRLVGGDSETDGRVEICRDQGFRRGVCDNNWDERDARVVCRELQLLLEDKDEPIATVGHGIRTRVSALNNTNCSGSELTLSRCPAPDPTQSQPTCDFAGVVCQGGPPLTNQPLAPSQSSYIMPMPTSITMLSTAAGRELSSTFETSPLHITQTSSKVSSAELNPTPRGPVATPTTSAEKGLSTSSVSTPTESVLPQGDTANNALTIGIALGVVGGVLALLVVFILVVVCAIIVGRKRRKQKYTVAQSPPSLNGHSKSPAPNNKRATTHVQQNGSSEYEETERVLLNPIYKQTTLLEPPDYAVLEEAQPNTLTGGTAPKTSPYYSTPTLLMTSSCEHTRPDSTTDSQGYTTPQLYDDTVNFSVSCVAPSSTHNGNGTTHVKVQNGSSNSVSINGNSQEASHVYAVPLKDTKPDSNHDVTCTENTHHQYAVLEGPL